VGRVYPEIGIHVQGPLRGDQIAALVNGAAYLRSKGKHLCITIVNEPGLPVLIKAVDPQALIFYRLVFTDHDPSPLSWDGYWSTGYAWFLKFWAVYKNIPGVDVWIFCNEWISKDWSAEATRRFGEFYKELVDACHSNGVVCTVGDFAVVTPELWQIGILESMLVEAERLGMWLNYHCYSSQKAEGNTDMAFESEWFAMRWQKYVVKFPRLKVLGGETGNSGGNGLYRPETPRLIVQMADMVR
jgi:hypothetical protein